MIKIGLKMGMIRYRTFIVRSKADNSQLNLPHCTITQK